MAKDPSAAVPALPVGRGTAIATASAGADARDENAVTRADGTHGLTGFDDLPHSLVTQNRARLYVGDVAFQDVQVGTADGDGVDSDDHIGGILQSGVLHILPVGPAGTVVHVRFHAHVLLTLTSRTSRRWCGAPLPA
ncbi:hypothetical protein N566_00395 [Streptomycetaceae bacterium MP113-05]|nr:hypothetical protein N566_00395 [Streptomycetaceae bacterium MP113-05]